MLSTKRARAVLGAVIAAGLAVTVFFGFAAVRSAVRLKAGIERRGGIGRWNRGSDFRGSGSRGADALGPEIDSIRGWMTVPHVERLFAVPADELFAELGIPPEGNRRKSLKELNRRYAPGNNGFLLEKLKEALRRRLGTGAGQPEAAP